MGSDLKYVYTFVRRDLPIQDQLVQACHSAMEAGSNFPTPGQISNLVLLDVKNKKELYSVSEYLSENGIDYYMFYEPDNGYDHTSITTEPLGVERKGLMSRFSLWRA